MSTKEVVYTLRDDKQELQKQLGCMNGIFQMFDRRYLLGQRRHGQNQKKSPPGQSDDGKKDFSNASEQAKEKNPKRVSFESSRNSVSSSCSSLDCNKKVQTEQSSSCQSVISEPSSSPILHRKRDLFIQPPDIRDVVKDSMTREPRVVSIKTTAKDERSGCAMKHVDSPRPFPDRYLAKEVKEMSRFSCDGRESRYLLKSGIKVKELPRFSLDSKQGYISNLDKDSRRNLLIKEIRPTSVVARLMGLEVLTETIDKGETLKVKPRLNQESVSNSRISRKGGSVITRIPLELAPWMQDLKPPFKNKEALARAEPGLSSIYGQIEKRLTEHEFKTSGKDLRALKQILEAMQKTRRRLENNELPLDGPRQKSNQPVSPTIKAVSPKMDIKLAKLTAGLQKVNLQKDSVGGQRVFRKSTGGTVSPKMQRSKNGIEKQSTCGPPPDPRRVKKEPTVSNSRTRSPKTKPIGPVQNSEESYGQHSDTVSFQSETNSLISQNDSEVISVFRPKENHRNNNIVERLIDDKPMADLAKHAMEQPSPVSVLDAFYTEDTPSPVKKKSNAFNDDKNLHFEEAQDQARIDNLDNSTYLDQYSEFNNVKLENIKNLVHQTELLNSTPDDATINHTSSSPHEGETQDHRYVTGILLASGFLKDLDHTITIAQLNPTISLINPELFHVLEKTKGCTEFTDDEYHKRNTRSKPNEKIRRKMVFDTVNDILGRKFGSFKHKAKFLNEEKLIKELCLEIEDLQTNSEKGVYDEEDEVINIINVDVNKRSRDWDKYCFEVPGLVLDIERLIFKDLISEVVNAEVTGLQDWPVRHRRQLFPM